MVALPLGTGRSVALMDADKALGFLSMGSLCQGSGGYRYGLGWSWVCGGCLGTPKLGEGMGCSSLDRGLKN